MSSATEGYTSWRINQRGDPSHWEEEIQVNPTILRLRSGSFKENLLPKTIKLWGGGGGQQIAHGASSSVDRESQNNTEATWDHYLHISPDASPYMTAVFSMIIKIYEKQSDDPMKDLKMNVTICGMLMNTTPQAAVHLRRTYAKNHIWESQGHLFEEMKRLICLLEILDSRTSEVVGLKTIELERTTWRSIILLCERVYQVTTVKVCVFSDLVLCIDETTSDPNATWMKKRDIPKTSTTRNWIVSTVCRQSSNEKSSHPR